MPLSILETGTPRTFLGVPKTRTPPIVTPAGPVPEFGSQGNSVVQPQAAGSLPPTLQLGQSLYRAQPPGEKYFGTGGWGGAMGVWGYGGGWKMGCILRDRFLELHLCPGGKPV